MVFSMLVALTRQFKLRFNNYKPCNRKFSQGSSVPQGELFWGRPPGVSAEYKG